MKFAAGLLLSTATGLWTWWRIKDPARPSDLLQFFLTTSLAMLGLLLMTLLLPEPFAAPAQEVLGWCLAGPVAALSFGAALRALEGLLDA